LPPSAPNIDTTREKQSADGSRASPMLTGGKPSVPIGVK
jgi:hypothetical protein